MAPFRVPFKVPFSSAGTSTAGPRVASNSVLGDTNNDTSKMSPVSKDAPVENAKQSPDDDVEVLSCEFDC